MQKKNELTAELAAQKTEEQEEQEALANDLKGFIDDLALVYLKNNKDAQRVNQDLYKVHRMVKGDVCRAVHLSAFERIPGVNLCSCCNSTTRFEFDLEE